MKRTFGLPARPVAAFVALFFMLEVGSAHAAPPPAAAPSSTPAAAPSVPAAAAAPAANATPKREPTAGDFATARTALKEGLALREKGDLQEALARLASAYDLVPTPVTGFELGKTHMMLGHVLQAHELFKKVVRMPPSMEESARSQTSRDESARLSRELEPRIPSLRLKLTLAPGASAVVKVDDDEIPLTGPETVRAVDPGPHDVTAKAGDGPEEKVHVDVAEAETKDVVLAPKWVAPKNPPPGKTTQIIYVRQTNPLAFVGFGVAAAALIVTTVSAFIYIDARNEAEDKCGNNYCPPARRSTVFPENTVIDTSFESENTRYQVSGAIMIAGAFTTALFFGLGVVGVARPVKERVVASPKIEPSVGLGRLGLTGTF
ncbi:MAG TPA: hypothetical protein VM925_24540 [Labilithrix sp.]|nr:hypothetical protein [Labilithrix sp.]